MQSEIDAATRMDTNTRRRRILVVDDEKNVALTLQAGLRKLPDCEAVAATSGEQALELIALEPFDLIVTDYRMAGIDGLALAGRVRELYPGAAILLVTAYADDALREQAGRLSVARILDKPVSLAVIRAAALDALNQTR